MKEYDESMFHDKNGREIHSVWHFLKELSEYKGRLPMLLPHAFLYGLYKLQPYAKDITEERFKQCCGKVTGGLKDYKDCGGRYVRAVTRGGTKRLKGLYELAKEYQHPDADKWKKVQETANKSTSYTGLLYKYAEKGD